MSRSGQNAPVWSWYQEYAIYQANMAILQQGGQVPTTPPQTRPIQYSNQVTAPDYDRKTSLPIVDWYRVAGPTSGTSIGYESCTGLS
jgi:hypothetical protein